VNQMWGGEVGKFPSCKRRICAGTASQSGEYFFSGMMRTANAYSWWHYNLDSLASLLLLNQYDFCHDESEEIVKYGAEKVDARVILAILLLFKRKRSEDIKDVDFSGC
jgi:hypothetical protein